MKLNGLKTDVELQNQLYGFFLNVDDLDHNLIMFHQRDHLTCDEEDEEYGIQEYTHIHGVDCGTDRMYSREQLTQLYRQLVSEDYTDMHQFLIFSNKTTLVIANTFLEISEEN